MGGSSVREISDLWLYASTLLSRAGQFVLNMEDVSALLIRNH